MNILISSAGRRTSLLLAFKDAARKRNGLVIATDADPFAPAPRFADKAFCVPRLDDFRFKEVFFKIIRDNKIKITLPTIDTELSFFSENINEFKKLGCVPLISSCDFIKIANDKWLAFEFFQRKKIQTPKTWLPLMDNFNALEDKILIKPRRGSASIGIKFLNKNEIQMKSLSADEYVIQETVSGREITVDILLDLEGNLIHYVPRIRIKTLGGESIQGETVPNATCKEFIEFICKEIKDMGAIGPITLQFFENERGCFLIEINPRFGGGFPLSLKAGGDYPEWILQMIEGARVEPRIGEYRIGLCMSRYNTEVYFEKNEKIQPGF